MNKKNTHTHIFMYKTTKNEHDNVYSDTQRKRVKERRGAQCEPHFIMCVYYANRVYPRS